MNSAPDLGGIFIVLDVTVLAFAQIINMREIGPWETDWIVISSGEATGQAGLVYFAHALKTFTGDKVVTRFRGSIPRLLVEKAIWNTKTMSKYWW